MKRLRSSDARVFPPEEFARLVMLAISSGEQPSNEAKDGHVDALTQDGSTIRVPVPDNPYQRATVAVSAYFVDDDVGLKSVMWRFGALMYLLDRSVLKRWVQHDSDRSMRIHPAVLDVASYWRLSDNGRFAQKKFVQAVEAVAAQNYPHLKDWIKPESI